MKRVSIIALFLFAGAGERLKAAVIFLDIEDITLGNPTQYVYRNLDLNSDGVADVIFQTGRSDLVCFSTVGGGVAGIPTVPPNQNHFAAAFSSGEILGVSFPTESLYRWNEGYSAMLSCRDAGCLGLWEDKTAYLGVKFASTGGIHYGWVEVFVFGNTSTGSILSYAYESEPDRAIIAGQIPEPCGTILAAASLASGLLRRRRRGGHEVMQDRNRFHARCSATLKGLVNKPLCCGGNVFDLLAGHGWQAGEKAKEIGVGVDVLLAAVADDGAVLSSNS